MHDITIVSKVNHPNIIVYSESEAPIEHAAEEMANFIREMTGVSLDVKKNPIIDEKPSIHIGLITDILKNSNLMTHIKKGKPQFHFDPQELGIEGAYIFLIQPMNHLIITGFTPRAVLYAVYTLCGDIWKCRWLSSDCEYYPKTQCLILPPNFFMISKPAFNYRMTTYIDAMDPEYATRNRFNINFFAEDIHGGKLIDQGRMTHTFYTLMPPNTYFKEHPEYYSLLPDDEGQKKFELKTDVTEIENLSKSMKLSRQASGSGGWGTVGQLCLTNKDVLDVVVNKVLEWRAEEPGVQGFGVAQNDSAAGYCLCPECMKINKKYGAISGSLIQFVSQVAEKVNEKAPNTQIFTLAYTYSEKPPKNIKSHPMNVVALCHMRPSCDSHPLDSCPKNAPYVENLKGWLKVTQNLVVWHYVVDFAHYLLPFPNLYSLSKDIKWYHENGVKGVLFQGNSSISKGCEFQELKSWLLAKISWDPTKDLWVLVQEFTDIYYGPASKKVQEWLHYINDIVEKDPKKCMDLYSGMETAIITHEIVDHGWKILKDAMKMVENLPEFLDRVELITIGFIYAELLMPYRAQEKQRIDELFAKFSDLCKKHNVTQLAEGTGWDHLLNTIKNNIITKSK
jgi:hypothetical protein